MPAAAASGVRSARSAASPAARLHAARVTQRCRAGKTRSSSRRAAATSPVVPTTYTSVPLRSDVSCRCQPYG